MIDNRNSAATVPGRLPSAGTGLGDFTGAAVTVAATGEIVAANERGGAILAVVTEAATKEITASARRAIAGNAMRLDRLAGPIFGGPADIVTLPLLDRMTALVLIMTDPAEAAVFRATNESRQRYQQLVEVSSDFVFETDSHGRFVFLSGGGGLGHAARTMLGRRASDFVLDTAALPFPVFQAREPVLATDVWLQRADGSISCQVVTALPLFDAGGAWCGARGMARDVTEERAAERAQHQHQLHGRLMAYLGNSFAGETDPGNALPAALAGTGLAIGADGGMILDGHPGLPSSQAILWGRRLPDRDIAELRAALAEQGIVDTTHGEIEVDGVATQAPNGDPGAMNGAILVWRDMQSGRFSDGDRELLRAVASRLGGAMRNRSQDPASPPKNHTGLVPKTVFTAQLERRLAELVAEQATGALVQLALTQDSGGASQNAAENIVVPLVRRGTRATDLLCRADDGFLVWLEGVLKSCAAARIDELIEHDAHALSEAGLPGLLAGVAIFDGTRPETVQSLEARASAALAEARRAGLGCVIAEPGPV
jgi:PAS domain S-box-containing protein